jgi:excinuclease UvrABC ATPase subunit
MIIKNLILFVKKNRNKVEKEKGFTRYLVVSNKKEEFPDAIEYFYLESPSVPKEYFPVSFYGIYDRMTVEEQKFERLKEDIIKILAEVKKFGIWIESTDSVIKQETKKKSKASTNIERFTDKNYDPEYNISYPEFTSKHFSPNRIEGACPHCSGIGEVLQVDKEKILDPES